MSIGDQFKGLDMQNLIGGPLMAAADASVLLARSTAEFINEVGFDSDAKTRNVLFKFQRKEPDADGNVSEQEMAVEVPMLAIVPIPNLQIDEVNIMFDMEVKQSSRSESGYSANASLDASAKIGPFKVAIKGSVATHASNTRSSDNSAKYHVDVRATNHGIPEGLARVLDMMAVAVSPTLISSRGVDQTGNELTGQRKERNLELKRLREERFQLESAENAARDTLDIQVDELISKGEAPRGQEQTELLAKINKLEEDNSKTPDAKAEEKEKLKAKSDGNNNYWNDFVSTIKSTAISAASVSAGDDGKIVFKKLIELRPKENSEKGIPKVTDDMEALFKDAIDAYRRWNESNQALQDNKVKYNNAMVATSVLATA